MKNVFFDVCVRCKRTFTSEAEFNKHMSEHAAPKMRKPIDEVEEKIRVEAESVPGAAAAQDEDAVLAAVRKTNTKRKKLIAAGIEAQTMTPEEVEARYAEEKKKGTVK